MKKSKAIALKKADGIQGSVAGVLACDSAILLK